MAVAAPQISEQVSEDLARAELLAFPLLFLFSLFVFRGVVAALLPLGVGMMTVLGAFLVMRGIHAVLPMSIFALNLIIGLGLGLAIDYSLFVVSRFREELERHGETAPALRRTMATAGRTVLFSAVTVAAALAALVVFPQRFLYSMGLGGAAVALVAAVVSLTVLPALLAVLGPRVNALSLKRWRVALQRDAAAERSGFWYRLSQWVMARAAPVAIATSVLLIAMGIPFLRVRVHGRRRERAAGIGVRAHRRRRAGARLPAQPGRGHRRRHARTGERARRRSRTMRSGWASIDGVAAVAPVAEPVGGLWRIDVIPSDPVRSEEAQAVVDGVRRRGRAVPGADRR